MKIAAMNELSGELFDSISSFLGEVAQPKIRIRNMINICLMILILTPLIITERIVYEPFVRSQNNRDEESHVKPNHDNAQDENDNR